MLLKLDTLRKIEAGEVDLAFRRWRSARVRAGTRMRTAVGLIEVVSVSPVAMARITAGEARRAGHSSRGELLELLRARPGGRVHRVELRHAGKDPRIALRARDKLAAGEARALEERLERMDRRSAEAWTRRTLELVRARPGVRAADLAKTMGSETRPFKARVRRLKELGLTESLDVGYRLSPRGEALMRRLGGRRPR